MLAPHGHRADVDARLEQAWASASIYDEAIRLLGRRGLGVAPECLERDWSQPWVPHESVREAWLKVYRNTGHYWDLYELAEELVDLEDSVQQWRFRPATPGKRAIGFKRGTRGTPGGPYLFRPPQHVFFSPLWQHPTPLLATPPNTLPSRAA